MAAAVARSSSRGGLGENAGGWCWMHFGLRLIFAIARAPCARPARLLLASIFHYSDAAVVSSWHWTNFHHQPAPHNCSELIATATRQWSHFVEDSIILRAACFAIRDSLSVISWQEKCSDWFQHLLINWHIGTTSAPISIFLLDRYLPFHGEAQVFSRDRVVFFNW